MPAPSRSILVALVPSGTIVGHVLGYVMAGEDAALHGGHSHLRPAAWAAAAIAAAALTCLALVRPSGARAGLRLSTLVSAQVALFALVEAAEHLIGGHDVLSFVTDPSFRWGLLAQLGSAVVLVAAAGLARASGERVRALLGRRRWLRHPARRRTWPPLRVVVPRRPSGSSVSERGPPRLLAPA